MPLCTVAGVRGCPVRSTYGSNSTAVRHINFHFGRKSLPALACEETVANEFYKKTAEKRSKTWSQIHKSIRPQKASKESTGQRVHLFLLLWRLIDPKSTCQKLNKWKKRGKKRHLQPALLSVFDGLIGPRRRLEQSAVNGCPFSNLKTKKD